VHPFLKIEINLGERRAALKALQAMKASWRFFLKHAEWLAVLPFIFPLIHLVPDDWWFDSLPDLVYGPITWLVVMLLIFESVVLSFPFEPFFSVLKEPYWETGWFWGGPGPKGSLIIALVYSFLTYVIIRSARFRGSSLVRAIVKAW